MLHCLVALQAIDPRQQHGLAVQPKQQSAWQLVPIYRSCRRHPSCITPGQLHVCCLHLPLKGKAKGCTCKQTDVHCQGSRTSIGAGEGRSQQLKSPPQLYSDDEKSTRAQLSLKYRFTASVGAQSRPAELHMSLPALNLLLIRKSVHRFSNGSCRNGLPQVVTLIEEGFHAIVQAGVASRPGCVVFVIRRVRVGNSLWQHMHSAGIIFSRHQHLPLVVHSASVDFCCKSNPLLPPSALDGAGGDVARQHSVKRAPPSFSVASTPAFYAFCVTAAPAHALLFPSGHSFD